MILYCILYTLHILSSMSIVSVSRESTSLEYVRVLSWFDSLNLERREERTSDTWAENWDSAWGFLSLSHTHFTSQNQTLNHSLLFLTFSLRYSFSSSPYIYSIPYCMYGSSVCPIMFGICICSRVETETWLRADSWYILYAVGCLGLWTYKAVCYVYIIPTSLYH